MANVWLYLQALWRQWRTLLMGGSLTAGALIFGLATGKNIATGAGWTLLGLTFVGASFGAWKEEHLRAVAPVSGATLSIRGVQEWGPGQPSFEIEVEIVNLGPQMTFRPDWKIDVTKADGTHIHDIEPLYVADRLIQISNRALPTNETRSGSLSVQYSQRYLPDATALKGARFVVTVSDVSGNILRAEYTND
jgi:hypothetical protein